MGERAAAKTKATKSPTTKHGAPPLKRKERHKFGHWLILVVNCLIALACFIGAAVLIIGQQVVNDIHKTEALETPTTPSEVSFQPTGSTEPPASAEVTTAGTEPEVTQTTVETFPDADPNAQNFLITGSDNGACNDPDSSTPVGERDTLGERSDTIMVMRVDPSTSRAAVLSFPRDLWVKISGTNSHNRINAAYKVDQPQRLVNTIYENFGIPIDHYIQIDFCAFKRLVDAVDGVTVPFAFPARDRHTNLNIPDTGCIRLDGDTALAYVRSRHYQYLDPDTGKYVEDPSADYGRISRQQDFLRRAVAKVLSQGFDLDVARGLIDVATKFVVTDPELTLRKQLAFAGVLQNLDPIDIKTYTIEGFGTTKVGASVIEPRLDGDNMQAILAIFRGFAQLESAPEQIFESTTSSVPRTTTTEPTSSLASATTAPATTTTQALPQVTVAQEVRGIVPPRDLLCP